MANDDVEEQLRRLHLDVGLLAGWCGELAKVVAVTAPESEMRSRATSIGEAVDRISTTSMKKYDPAFHERQPCSEFHGCPETN